MKNISIIAGPCSVDRTNINQVRDILSIEINGKKAIAGTRIVGLKSRTTYNSNGNGMGMDFSAYNYNLKLLLNGKGINEFIDFPSMIMAQQIQNEFNCIIATEIMDPSIQMPLMERTLKGNVIAWNPAVMQLGWPVYHMSKYCEKNNWFMGFKNPKNLGITLKDAEENNISAPLEKVWSGMTTYSNLPMEKKILIHRGVDSEIKSNYRNELIHNTSKRVKQSLPGCLMFFDPSHSYGPKLRDDIVEGTIFAMKMKDDSGKFLYDGILIEVGDSSTDTDQHITIEELKLLINTISEFREL